MYALATGVEKWLPSHGRHGDSHRHLTVVNSNVYNCDKRQESRRVDTARLDLTEKELSNLG